MTWQQIKEIEKESFTMIGHHSHSHEYMINWDNTDFVLDIEKSSSIFKKSLDTYQHYFLTLLVNILNL